MEAAVERFLDKDDPLAIDYIVDYRFEKMLKELKEQKVNADETDLIALFNRMRDEDEKMDLKEEQDFLDKFKKSICKEKSAKTSTSGACTYILCSDLLLRDNFF